MKPVKTYLFILLISLLGCNSNSDKTMATEQRSDTKKIETMLQDYAIHWNNNDMDAWGTLFTEDIDYINRNGGWWKNNRDNIAGHKYIHTMLVENKQPKTFRLEIRKIEFLKPDIAVVQASSEWPGFKTNNEKEPVKTLKGIMSCVFVKTDGEWLIKSLHNTLITE